MGDSVMIEELETVSDASDWSWVKKSGEIWNLRLCLEKCQSEEVYDQAASAAGSNGNDGNYGISCLLRGDSSILQRSRLRTRKSSWHWGGGDRSQSLFLYIPQEKNITVKLVRLGRRAPDASLPSLSTPYQLVVSEKVKWSEVKWSEKWSVFGALFFLKLKYIIDHVYT